MQVFYNRAELQNKAESSRFLEANDFISYHFMNMVHGISHILKHCSEWHEEVSMLETC